MFTISSQELRKLKSMIGRIVTVRCWGIDYIFNPDPFHWQYDHRLLINNLEASPEEIGQKQGSYKGGTRFYDRRKMILVDVESDHMVLMDPTDKFLKIKDRLNFLKMDDDTTGPEFHFNCVTDLIFEADETHSSENISIRLPWLRYELIPLEIRERVQNMVKAVERPKDDDY